LDAIFTDARVFLQKTMDWKLARIFPEM